ncbi:hypothetical protein K3495_g2823 [Podosphaera aphanis]|nr:hypothetical protein K3495_g2823 [Podosphaera aphanis]
MPLFKIKDGICAGMGMRSANGNFNSLQNFVTFDFEIDGIHRVISAFVRPNSPEKFPSSDLSLILGQPWIWSVHGVPEVREGKLHFGDTALGEARKVLHTTKFHECKYQKLLLIPNLPQYREKVELAEKLMEQQIPVDMAIKPLVTHQKDYYITRDGRRYDFDPTVEILSASRHHPDDPDLGSSTTIISTDQYDTQTTSGLEQLSTSSDEADINSDSHSLSDLKAKFPYPVQEISKTKLGNQISYKHPYIEEVMDEVFIDISHSENRNAFGFIATDSRTMQPSYNPNAKAHCAKNLRPGEENNQTYHLISPGKENSLLHYSQSSTKERNYIKNHQSLNISAWKVIQAAKTGQIDDPQVCQMMSLLEFAENSFQNTDTCAFNVEIDMSKTSDPSVTTIKRTNLTETFRTTRSPKPIDTACPNYLIQKVKRLFYTYRDLHASSQLEITPTDLHTHRVRLAQGTKPHNDMRKIRLSDKQRYWLNKVIDEGLRCGMYERTTSRGKGLSSWNSKPVVVLKNSDLDSEMRVTFNYSRVTEIMPGCHMALLREVRDYLSDPRHLIYCQFDFKNAYWSIGVHPEDRHILAFFVDGIGQPQPTVLPQGCQSATFTLTELMYIIFGEIPLLQKNLRASECDGSEPSLLRAPAQNDTEPINFYMDDLFTGNRTPDDTYHFLENRLLPRIAWGMLKLSFKKVKVFMKEIEACGTLHKAGGIIVIKHKRADKINNFPLPTSQHGVMSFLATVGVTRNWGNIFGEIARPLQRLTGNVPFQWGPTEQVSFDMLRELCSAATEMHGINPVLPV